MTTPSNPPEAKAELLAELFETLDPEPERVARVERVLRQELAAASKSLAAEWVELLRLRPMATPALAFAGCAGLLLLSPLAGMLGLLLGRLGGL